MLLLTAGLAVRVSPAAAACEGIEIAVSQNEHRCLKPGAGKVEQFKDCLTCPEMVMVPAGRFTMGSSSSEPGRHDRPLTEEPQHEVTISMAFAVGRYAVTRGEFATFVAETNHTNPRQHLSDRCNTFENGQWDLRPGRTFRNPGFTQDDRHPVVCVDWDDARAYASWVSRKSGKTYRLLSEAEREYVTRAGTTTAFWWGSSITAEQANYNGNVIFPGGGSKGEYRQRTVPVDSFRPNPWGLYNVHGNVWEWTEDCWHENYQGAPTDGSAWISGQCITSDRALTNVVVRGGSWFRGPRDLRSASRGVGYSTVAINMSSQDGFRVARTLDR
jgi:formylglycine-generating enzyme required for sulfatase activity